LIGNRLPKREALSINLKTTFVEKNTMTVDDKLISRLAKLSRLSPSPAQSTKLQQDLKNILGMVEKLDELELDAVEPLRYVTGVENVLRPDTASGHIDRELALKNAPDADEEGGFFRVPRVI
jgi:aspartyl-tRNA(Asn)/glutamyl-tRNA(Gln) amidotransferase subunit C